MTNPIINPESINILCSAITSPSNSNEHQNSDSEPKQPIWNKLKQYVKEFCELAKPIVEIIIPLIKTFAIVSDLFHARNWHGTRKRGKGYAYNC